MGVQLGLLGINLDAFPSGGLPLVSAMAFHGGIALILLLYFQFWINVSAVGRGSGVGGGGWQPNEGLRHSVWGESRSPSEEDAMLDMKCSP